MNSKPDWYYNEYQQLTIDFADEDMVAGYTQKQGATPQDSQALIDRLGVQSNDVVIEMGCGTGVFCVEAAKQCNHVCAVDVSLPMLNHAKQLAADASLSNISFHHAGFLTYEHEGDKANVIVTQFALHHLSDFWKVVAFRRMAEMLTEGGILYLKDIIYSFPISAYEETITDWIQQVAKPAHEGFTKEEFDTHVRDEYSTFNWVIENMLIRTGFEIKENNTQHPTYGEFIATKRW